MRGTVETTFQLRTGGAPLVPWVVQARSDGKTFEEIADRLSHLVGLHIPAARLRQWVADG